MKLKYDEIEIDVEVDGLVEYAKQVCKEMQNKDVEYADCWTGCVIEFLEGGVIPDIHFGSIEDMDSYDENCIKINVPLNK